MLYLVRECFAQASVSPHVTVQVNPSAAAKAMARIGRAIAIIDPWPMIIDPSPDLVMRPFRPRVPFRIVYLHSPHRQVSRVAEHFVGRLRREVVRASRKSGFVGAEALGPAAKQPPLAEAGA